MTNFYKTPEQLAAEAREVKAGMALAALAMACVLLPLQSFVLMLTMGALHGIAAAVPAVGYGTAVLLTMGVDLLAFSMKKFRK